MEQPELVVVECVSAHGVRLVHARSSFQCANFGVGFGPRGQRRRDATTYPRGDPLVRIDVAAGDAHHEHAGAPVLAGLVVEDEVAEAVVDERSAQMSGPLEHVRVRADDDVGAGGREDPGELLLAGRRASHVLDAPVEVDDDRVDLRSPRLDRCDHAVLARLFGRGEAALDVGGRPGVDVLGVEDVGGAEDRDPLALHVHSIWRVRLGRVRADADDGELLRGPSGQRVGEPLGPVVLAVVVGLRRHVDAAGSQRVERGRGRPEVEVLRLDDATLGDGRLEVDHGDVGADSTG